MNGRRCTLERGILHIDGEPRILIGGDYPYYRDARENWRDRLEAQRETGLDVVTAYVPWRHHAPLDPLQAEGAYDFTGRTQANRDLVGFLDIVEELGMQTILKPGPFVHAELPHGGLPDYVDPERHPAVEPELDASGRPIRWALSRMLPHSRRVLPAPLGEMYNAYVRHWFAALAREVVAPRFHPHGCVLALQLMNEGIYSDSGRADPRQLGYAVSTLHRFHEFLAERYETMEAYNQCHGTRFARWSDIDPPRRVGLLAAPRALLAYLDWSAFQGRLYRDVAARYRAYLVEAGVPEDAPAFFNFNPNSNTYRAHPASNDGWYTRVLGALEGGFTFGTTSWLGVLASDPIAFRQYVMALTASRGPGMEQNWGFSTQYDELYAYVTPSHFESMLSLAAGATGINAYVFSGTRAWRDDPNLRGEWVPPRTNRHRGAASEDYPGDAPVRSTGERTPKTHTLAQMAHYLRSEGSSFVRAGPRAEVAWVVYPPYAWAGQWLTKGDADDVLWRPPLLAIPRAAYHGLDAFAELMIGEGRAFRQVDLSGPDVDLSDLPCLVLSGHEYMDGETQDALASYVEEGGRLLLTGLVPDKDLRLEPLQGSLATRVFPHALVAHRELPRPQPLTMEGEPVGLAIERVCVLRPPRDSDLHVRMGDDVVGYRRRVGDGVAVFLGAGPWRAVHSRDDPFHARESQRLMRALLARLELPSHLPRPVDAPAGEVMVWQHGVPGEARQHVFVVVRDTEGEVRVDVPRSGAGRDVVRVRTPSQAVHAIGLERGRLRSCYLKGVNDVRAQGVAPSVSARGETWEADRPCDLCVTPADEGAFEVSVAHAEGGEARVRLGEGPWVHVPDVADGRRHVVVRRALAGER